MQTMTVNALNWMSGIEDATPLHEVSIPGSHESCSLWSGESLSPIFYIE